MCFYTFQQLFYQFSDDYLDKFINYYYTLFGVFVTLQNIYVVDFMCFYIILQLIFYYGESKKKIKKRS